MCCRHRLVACLFLFPSSAIVSLVYCAVGSAEGLNLVSPFVTFFLTVITMKVQTLVARTLVSGLLSARMPSDPVGQTPNIPDINVLATGSSGTCETGFTDCGTGCMPTTSICCGT
jgi:hypothetical protein